jgi:salicylate hydroxylase
MGDAAHATTPWQGAGAGLAMEDAMVLGKLVATIPSSTDIGAAFRVYDMLRRPRCQQAIDSSRYTGMILCGQISLDPDKLRELLMPRWNFLFGLDMAAHEQEALDTLKKYQEN